MPSSNNLIQSLRSAHDPHFKLEGRVGGLEKGLGIEVAKLHKTLSKSFAMQRKTLARVLGLEGRVSDLESQQAAEDQAKEGIDEILDDILGDSGDKPKKKPAAKKKKRPAKPVGKKIPNKKPVAKKKKISAESLKKGTSQGVPQWFLDETARREKKKEEEERHARIREENIAADANKGSVQHRLDADSVDATTGETLSGAERKRRFLLRRKGIKAEDIKRGTSVESAENVAPNNEVTDLAKRQAAADLPEGVTEPPAQSTGELSKDGESSTQESPMLEGIKSPLKAIAESIDRIKDSLTGQSKVQEDALEDARKSDEEKEAKKRESGLEKFLGPVKAAGEKILKPFKSMFSQVFDFLTTILFGRIAFKLFEWFSNPANTDKIKSIFNFLKDWWPVIVAGIMAIVGPGITFAVGLVALLAWGIPKIVNAVKSVFGFGKDIDKELKTGEDGLSKDVEKIGSDAEKKLEPEKEDKDMPSQDTPAEVSDVQKSADDVKNVENFAKGGEVPGSGDKDTVPAMLTPGEFVMSKGAVEQYGVQTLEGMNAAAGGTNSPTIQKGGMNLSVPRFGGGGSSTTKPTVSPAQSMIPNSPTSQGMMGAVSEAMSGAPSHLNAPGQMEFIQQRIETGEFDYENLEHREQLVNAISPIFKKFVEDQNRLVDEDPEAFNGVRLKMDRDGRMPNFGEWVSNQSEAAFNMAIQQTQKNDTIPPEAKEIMTNYMIQVRRETIDDPDFKSDLVFDINKDIPGTAAYRLLMRAQADTTSPAAMAGISARDRAFAMNKMGYAGGGLVSNNSRIYSTSNGGSLIQKFNQGGEVKSPKNIIKFLGNKAKGAINFAKDKIAKVSGNQKSRVDHLHLDPPKKLTSSKAAATQVAQSSANAATVSTEKAPGLPPIDAASMRSQSKIRTLGLSV